MMKFSALNESSLSDDNGDPELASREAQEEEAYSLYHSALKKQSEGKTEEAENMLKEILEMEFLTQAQPSEDSNDAPLGPALTLKYLLYKNLANVSNAKKDFRAAVEYFLEALEIDGTDVFMWYQIGKAALNIHNYALARLCFEEGLKCNPNHWPCIDNVITVMHALNDYANCLYYIAKALERECYYLKGLAFKDEIYREDPSLKSFCEGYFKKCDSSIHFAEYDKEEAKKFIQESLDMRAKKQSFYKPTPQPVLSLTQPIKENTWKSLGESLISMYDCIKQANPTISFTCKIDLSPYVGNSNKNQDIGVDKHASPSPVSSLSEACSSNSAAAPYAVPTSQKSDGLLQLATLPPEDYRSRRSSVIDMEVDEIPTTSANASPYSLVLPQIDTTPTDLSICADSTSSNKRTSKRKRLLSELTELSAKRRSSRVRNPAVKKPQDNINYQELLQKFLPPKLIGDGKCEDPDFDSEPTSLDKTSADVSCGQSSDNDKRNICDLTSSEKEDVSQFLANNQSNAGIIDLLYKYVVFLGRKNTCIWPKNLVDVFCETFSRLRNHITTPNLFSHSADRDRIKEIGLAILTYCEFKVDKWYLSTGHSMSFSPKTATGASSFQNGNDRMGNDFHSDMEFLVMLTVRRDVLEKDWLDFSARALWLKAKFHSLEGEIDLAICCMEKLSDVLCDENDIKITVQNSSFSNIITADKVQQQLESLQRCQSLEEVQRLYEHGDYNAVVNLLILTFNQPRTKRKQSLDGVPERHAQLLLLQNSLLKLERYRDCVFWSEVSFNEALQQFMNAARSDWSETMAHLLNGLDKCIKLDAKYIRGLDDSKLVRLTQNLILVIVIQMENYDFSSDNASLLVVLPWITLYHLILNEENRTPKKASNVDLLNTSMPSSLMLLFSAHEYLGRRSWCTAADGLLLFHIINVCMAELQDNTGKSYLYKEELEAGLEQCIYCLYGHPHKRTRAKHLQEHSARQIPLTWEKACLIFQYFKPNVLPEFDSYRTSTVSAELESLLKRISALVPPDEDPTNRVDNYTAYIEGVTEKCPEAPFKDKTISLVVKDLYYLLADYYFKNKEFSKAIRFYLMDICINPDRQDSWAGMALSRSSQLDQKLNSYELRNESTIYRKSAAALKCFEHSLELDPTTTSLWIEHGSLAYILHSHASRQLKQDAVCDELYELLKKKKLEMLQVAEKCFRAANHCDDGGEPEEAWLHHYMLGKICEKKGEGPAVYMDHYQKALMYLHEDFARYPQKIQYHNPLELSVEALEVYYRIHASCLKFLWKYEDIGIDLATLKIIRKCLSVVAKSPFANFQEKCKKEISCSSSAPSELEDNVPNTSNPVESVKIVDHNYYDNVEKDLQKITEDSTKRQSRSSIDSPPDTQDKGMIKEVVDSLVGAVAERCVDEELAKKNASSDSKKDSKIIIEIAAEESVYTSKLSSAESSPPDSVKQPLSPSKQIAEAITKIPGKVEKEVEKEIFATEEPEMVIEEKDELTKQRELALELEAEAAASKLVEEMRLESDALGDMDYCSYDIYSTKHESYDPSIYYECMDFIEEQPVEQIVEESVESSEIEEDILSAMSAMLDKLEESEISSSTDVEMLEAAEAIETEAKNEVGEISVPRDDVKAEVIDASEILDSEMTDDTGELQIVENEQVDLVTNVSIELVEQKSDVVSDCNIKALKDDKKVKDSPKPDSVDEEQSDTKTDAEVTSTKDNIKEIAFTSTKTVEETKKNTTEENNVDKPPKCINSEDEQIATKDSSKNQEPIKTHCTKDSKNTEESKVNKQKNKKPVEKSAVSKEIAVPPTPEELLYSQSKIAELIPVCLDAMRECLQRFIQHYKSLYRMAHYYCHSKKNKNLQWAREILLAATPPTKKYPSMPGLFADRKNTNFFNGIWRAPSNEIDRPGSFGAHMYRSIALLIQVLTEQKDYNMLVLLTQQLYRTPDLGKKYMRDTDRVYLVRRAYDCCVNILRDQMNSLLQEEPPPEESRLICCLLEIYRTCQTLLKAGIYADETNDLLEEAYTMYRMGEVDSHPSVLEQATKFCQMQLGKSYPNAYEMNKSSSKYVPVSDASESNLNVPMPSVSAYTPDAWQKEFAKSLMMPVLPCKSKTKQEVEPNKDPLILIPIENKFNKHLVQNPIPNQRPVVSTQMVHVEKPKAENLQACSVAFLPVTPVFSKDAVNLPNAVQATSLLSCQAYECFDVLTSIMQASGYKVAPQTMAPPPTKDNNAPINLVKAKPDVKNVPCATSTSTPKGNVGRPKKRKRKAPFQKMEALNLCKRMSTKPIVSTSIAHSIAELKVGPIVSIPKVAPPETVSSSFTNPIPSVLDNSNSKIQIISDQSSQKPDISTENVKIPNQSSQKPEHPTEKTMKDNQPGEIAVAATVQESVEITNVSEVVSVKEKFEKSTVPPKSSQAIESIKEISPKSTAEKIEICTSESKSPQLPENTVDTSLKADHKIVEATLESTQIIQKSVNTSETNDKGAIELSTFPIEFQTSTDSSGNDNIILSEVSTSKLMSTHLVTTSVDGSGNVNLKITERPSSSLNSNEIVSDSADLSKNDSHAITESCMALLESIEKNEISVGLSGNENVAEIPSGIATVSENSVIMENAAEIPSSTASISQISENSVIMENVAETLSVIAKVSEVSENSIIMENVAETPSVIAKVSENSVIMENVVETPSVIALVSDVSENLVTMENSAVDQISSKPSTLMEPIVQESEALEFTSEEKKESTVIEGSHTETDGIISGDTSSDENNDSSSSTNIEMCVIEQCAKEMLEFINKKVEDMVLNTKSTTDFPSIEALSVSRELAKNAALLKTDFENVIEDNSDTLDAEIKDESLCSAEVKNENEVVGDLKSFENQLNILKEESEITPTETCESLKEPLVELITSSPKSEHKEGKDEDKETDC
ncbi:calcineurin-binding protein cabin-1-like isoform X2 [Argiope bruennichi]|uniref:calcineurin-binding protein cabin-1-like isoform X2 n=1 Tax=Argiope bruennichi TaxID=94029 RepID=UPI002495154B|nr:calcineurin-binding protein cabin-1-like isoform X2 [Argiope bruennichi]